MAVHWMRAYRRVGNELELQPGISAPSARAGEVVVKVAYWGILPFRPRDLESNMTVVGKVIAVGDDVPAFRLGDWICAACNGMPDVSAALLSGELGEYQRVLVDETVTLQQPFVLPFAALLPAFYARAERLLRWAQLAREEDVLVMGADQGLGLAVAHLSGLRSNGARFDKPPHTGTWHSILGGNYDRAARPDACYDVIIDCRLDATHHELLPKLKPNGIYLRENGLLIRRNTTESQPDERYDPLMTSELELVADLFQSSGVFSQAYPVVSFEDVDRVRDVLSATLEEPIVISVPR